MSGATDRAVKEKLAGPMSAGQVLAFCERIASAHRAGLSYEQARWLLDSGLFDDVLKAPMNDLAWLTRPEAREQIREELGLNRYWIDFEDTSAYSRFSYREDVQHPNRVRGRILWNPAEFDVVQWVPPNEKFLTIFRAWTTLVNPPGVLWPARLIRFLATHPEQLPEQFRDKQIWFWTAFNKKVRSSGYSMACASYTLQGEFLVYCTDDFVEMLRKPHWVAVRKVVTPPMMPTT